MIRYLWKWMRGQRATPNAMEDMLMTERKQMRRKRALARFKVLTYLQWCDAHNIVPDDLVTNSEVGYGSEVAYAEYVARKDQERRALEGGQH